MRIRRAEDADLPAINALTRRSSAYAGEYRAMVEGIEVTPEQLRRDHCFVAVEGERLLGYYSLVADPPDLDLMFVDDAARGRGVGRLLFEHMLATARELGATEVRIVSHPPAAGFYERMGAVRAGTKAAAGRVTWDRPVLQVEVPGAEPHPAVADQVRSAALARLERERDDLLARLARLDEDMTGFFEASRDSNADDEHDPEGQTIAFERSQLAAVTAQTREHLAEVEAAIERVRAGTYGTCEACGQPINPLRLEARPTARTCVEHASSARR